MGSDIETFISKWIYYVGFLPCLLHFLSGFTSLELLKLIINYEAAREILLPHTQSRKTES